MLVDHLYRSGLMPHAAAVQIASGFRSKHLQKGESLLKIGQVSNEYLFVEEGLLRSFVIDIYGSDVTTAFFQAGDMVFEIHSYFNRAPSKENIIALTNCRGWYITYDELNTLFHTMPEFREFGRSVLVRGSVKLKMHALSMITETAEQRYANLLKNNPEIIRNAPLKNIASYLGITDTSLSRIRKELTKKHHD